MEHDNRMPTVRNTSLSAWKLATLSLSAATLALCSSPAGYAQSLPRIHAPIEGSSLVALPGTVHPWARAEFDRGAAPDSVSGRLLLVLSRSPEQDADLKSLLAAQQEPGSPEYHHWLTAESFGKRFGAADADLQAVTSYLSAQGMQVGRVYKGHGAIEVSATAAQIRSTFHSEVHAYSVGGKTYYANSTPIQVPAALRSVVSGVASLNNFRVSGGSGEGTTAQLDAETHTLKPLYTTTVGGNIVYPVTPGDLTAIYSVPSASGVGLGGQNVNVGVLGDSNINVSYINSYRSIFGLTARTPTVVVDGNDPGINSDAFIAYKQIELIGAVAPNANIYYYTSASTDYDTGLNFAMIRAVEDNKVQVLVNGFQSCETALGSEMGLINQLYEQAAAQGITVVAAAGNTGAGACETPGSTALASTGLNVNGYASSPYVTAVGGTDFYYSLGANSVSNYWIPANSQPYSTAGGYIQEQVWNDSTQPNTTLPGPAVELAGGGGISTAGLDGVSKPQPIPSYQSSNAQAVAISSTARIVPDIALFAGSGANDTIGYNQSAYAFCLKPGDCQTGSSTPQFTYSGGTEASSAVFAGAMALVINFRASGSAYGLGNVNPTLYSILTNGTTVNHDITIGNNELLCTGGGTAACTGGQFKLYTAKPGYDAASGLGSFNITSLVQTFVAPNTTASNVTLSVIDPATGLPPVCTSGSVVTSNCTTHSTPLKFVVTASKATGAGTTPTGDVSIFTTNPLAAQQAVESMTLSGGVATDASYNLLPGGTYKLYARYAGDTTYTSSVTANPYTITVKPENCNLDVYSHNVGYTSTTVGYGSPITITAEPYSAQSDSYVGIPSGSMTVTDTYAGTTKTLTTLPLNSEGAATFSSNLLASGLHSIVLSYNGDASMGSCQTKPFLANITKATTTTQLNAPDTDTGQGNAALGITAIVTSSITPNNATAPTGTVTFSTAIPKTVTLVPGFDQNGNAIATASTTVGQADVPAGGMITATYNPATTEVNYSGSSSSAVKFYSTVANLNHNTITSFTITDNSGTQIATGLSTLPYPTLDSMTLNLHVVDTNPKFSVFVISANGVQLTPPVQTNGSGQVTGGGVAPDNFGNATFAIPQSNGYLALPSGQVQLSVEYVGWVYTNGTNQANPSTANQLLKITDDRTSADFSLQSDTTVNQQNPLLGTTTQAVYGLRLTSIYNFQSAYPNTAINLGCSILNYTNAAGVRSTVPAGLQCGFDSSLTSTASVTFGANSTASGFITKSLYVGAASGFAIASNTTTTTAPASRWWLAGGAPVLACIFLLGLPARRRHWNSIVGVFGIVFVAFTITGCGLVAGSGSRTSSFGSISGSGTTQATGGTPVTAGPYTVLVTATSAANTTLVHTLPVQVIVGAGPTASITTNAATITKGTSTTLTVTTANATGLTVTGSDGSSYTLPVAGGSFTVTPAATTTYTATVTSGSQTSNNALTITVK